MVWTEDNLFCPDVKKVETGDILHIDRLGACDAFIVAIGRMEDPFIHVFRRDDCSYTGSFGTLGQGPGDFNFPFFLSGESSGRLQLYDVNLASFKQADIEKAITRKPDAIVSDAMPKSLVGSPNLYRGKGFYMGNMDGGLGQFFIYDTAEDRMEWIGFPRQVKNEENDFSVMNRIAVNEEQGKVVSAMYYYNKVFLYDTKGKLLKEAQIGEQAIAPLIANKTLDEESLRCCTDIGMTSDYVYLLMQSVKEKDFAHAGIAASRITVLDWNLNYVKTYVLPHYVWSLFVDERQKRILYVPIEDNDSASICYFDL